MAGPGEKAVRDFHVRPLVKPEEFRAAEEVQRLAFAGEDDPALSMPLARAFRDNGGLVVGAFADIHLAGWTAGFLGWDGTTLYLQSYLTAVRPEYQNHRLGFRLKAYQREEVLRQGLSLIRWTFDPLQSRVAFLSSRRLGAQVDQYLPNYLGHPSGSGSPRFETDRVRVSWALSGPGVAERVGGQLPTAADDAARVGRSFTVLETEVGEHGLRVPSAVAEPSGPEASLEVPFDLGTLREHEPASFSTWRHAVRDAFRAALDLGYVVDDFAVVSKDHERRSFYLLNRGAARKPS